MYRDDEGVRSMNNKQLEEIIDEACHRMGFKKISKGIFDFYEIDFTNQV